jgi:restriction endonuclease S subunit
MHQRRVKTIKIPVPDIKTQQTLVSQIEQLENKITTAQKTINESSTQKQSVLKRYL